jgi:phage tail sheath protein FI
LHRPASNRGEHRRCGRAVPAEITWRRPTTRPALIFRDNKQGLYALEKADLVNLIVVPPYTAEGDVEDLVVSDTIAYAGERRAMLVLDPPSTWNGVAAAESGAAAAFTTSEDAAIYFPCIRQPDPLRDGQLQTFAPSGAVAGLIAATDASRGGWKAPAELEATLSGVTELSVPLSGREIGRLNPLGVNCLRAAPAAGHVIWEPVPGQAATGSPRRGSTCRYGIPRCSSRRASSAARSGWSSSSKMNRCGRKSASTSVPS